MYEDLIKRGDVLSTLERVFKKCNIAFGGTLGGFGQEVPKEIESIPAIHSPVKPIRITVGNCNETDGCPICRREFYEKFNFCPDCGAKIDWGGKE